MFTKNELIFFQMTSLFGMGEFNVDTVSLRVEELLETIRHINQQFKNPVITFNSRHFFFLT